jgi:hypothetical protein
MTGIVKADIFATARAAACDDRAPPLVLQLPSASAPHLAFAGSLRSASTDGRGNCCFP